MLEAGTQLSQYRILRRLGSGGMADVYEAEDIRLGRHVALKLLPPEFSRNEQLIARFEKEVRAVALLNHNGIVTVFEVGQHEQYHYYTMRLLGGGDLRKRIERGMQTAEALQLLRELAVAFGHAHSRGFVHRDIKPENILFDEDGHAVVTDFGIAKALDSGTQLTTAGVAVGTPRYMSPEQARGRPVDARADLYSLGVMFHEMLTGRPPYDAEETLALVMLHLTEPIPRLPAAQARMQPLLDALMAKDQEQRPENAQALIALIDGLDSAQPTTAVRRPASTIATQINTAVNPALNPPAEPAAHRPAPRRAGMTLTLVMSLMLGVLAWVYQRPLRSWLDSAGLGLPPRAKPAEPPAAELPDPAETAMPPMSPVPSAQPRSLPSADLQLDPAPPAPTARPSIEPGVVTVQPQSKPATVPQVQTVKPQSAPATTVAPVRTPTSSAISSAGSPAPTKPALSEEERMQQNLEAERLRQAELAAQRRQQGSSSTPAPTWPATDSRTAAQRAADAAQERDAEARRREAEMNGTGQNKPAQGY